MPTGSLLAYVTDFVMKAGVKQYRAAICVCNWPKRADDGALTNWLHSQEKGYLDSLLSRKSRRSYLLGRYTAKRALDELINQANIQGALICPGVFNQPVVKCLAASNIQVSIAHSGDMGVSVAFPEEVPLGIDVEIIDPTDANTTQVLESQATDTEKHLIDDISPYPDLLTILWTAKESLSKALRIGLTASYSIFEVKGIEIGPGHFTSHFKHFHQYSAMSFNLLNYMCSIAYPNQAEIQLDVQTLRESFRFR